MQERKLAQQLAGMEDAWADVRGMLTLQEAAQGEGDTADEDNNTDAQEQHFGGNAHIQVKTCASH